jgi:hypothetical protein
MTSDQPRAISPGARSRADSHLHNRLRFRPRTRPRLEWMEDRTLLSTFAVVNTADNGPGSLRQAILDSNAATGQVNTIEFAIPGDGVQTIAPLSPLPTIVNPVLIDGESQPGYSGMPSIEIDGSGAGVADGLLITGSNISVRGLDVVNFIQGAGIHITGAAATGDWIYGDLLGTNPAGTSAAPNYTGVQIDAGASRNLIGTIGDGVNDLTERNLISGNQFDGVWINGPGTDANVVAGNFIGTDISGASPLINSTLAIWDPVNFEYTIDDDVVIAGGASGNRIGTDGGSADDVGERNVVLGIGLYDSGTTENVIAGNFIGTDATGQHALAGNAGAGVFLTAGASSNWIGINPMGGTASHDMGNVIAGNGGYGVQLFTDDDDNVVSGNEIGTDLTGSIALPNLYGGINIMADSSDNTIGGTTASAGNLITDNDGAGVTVGYGASDSSVGDQITANRIFGNTGQAIDLGGDGVTYNYTSPRQGANNLQNFPVIVTGANGQLEGWLGGSLPETTYRVDLFASAAYNSDGSGEAEDYLGSMAVTTDSQGQAVFNVPFTPPAGLPEVTALATDPQGNTSEVSALRPIVPVTLPPSLRVVPGHSLTFSAAAGDLLAIQDPDAGPLAAAWDLTLSVTAGNLTLAGTAGLTGSGDGTGSLSYSGTLTAVNAALAGLVYAPPAGPHVFATLTLAAGSNGAQPCDAQFALTDGVFVVTTALDSGAGSLRQAILDANTVDGPAVTIDFDIPGAGVRTIAPVTPLPPISGSVIVDGTTEPGFAGAPLVALDGPSTASSGPLAIAGGTVTVRGIAFQGVAIEPATDENLTAVVSAGGLSTQLSLLDSQGKVLVDSDGISPADPDTVIDEHLAPGAYSLGVDGTGGPVAYTWTIALMPSSVPFEGATTGDLNPIAAVAGDFNGDGNLDLAITGGSVADVSILLGNGDGTFAPPVTYPVGAAATAIAADDFNGNGKLDLAVTDTLGVQILMGNGDGTFGAPITYAAGPGPGAIVAGDFIGNGHLDLAATNLDTDQVSILLGNGDGTFRPPVSYDVGSRPAAIVAGDFRGDGRIDLGVADEGSVFSLIGDGGSAPGGVSVLLGNGNGTFQPAVEYAAGLYPDSIVAADFNGDGHLDLAVADAGSTGVSDGSRGDASVLLGNGDGTFRSATLYPMQNHPTSIVAADFNGDGRLDLAVANAGGSDVSVLVGNGDGSFQQEVSYSAGVYPWVVVPGDFNGDGRVDLAVLDQSFQLGTVTMLLGNGNATFETADQNALELEPSSIVSGDLTGDGILDLAVADAYMDEISVLMGNGDGTFQAPVQYAVGSDPFQIVVGDWNGDGRPDLAVLDGGTENAYDPGNEPGGVSVLLGNGDGTFQPAVEYAAGAGPSGIVAGDFTGDGKLDLAVTDRNSNDVAVLLGKSNGRFGAPIFYPAGSEPNAIAAGDFNGDGKLDLAVTDVGFDDGSNDVSILLGNGDSTFGAPVSYAVGLYPEAIAVGDFAGSGHQSLAIANEEAASVSILLGNGDGTFQPAVSYATGIGPVSLVAGNFTGNGPLDLAVADVIEGVSVLLGNGDGTFQPAVSYPAGDEPISIVAGDFNGAGQIDLAIANFSSLNISVLLGTGEGTFADASQFDTTPHATPVLADFTGDGADDVLEVDASGDIIYRQGIPGQPGSFLAPVTVNAGNPSRDIAVVTTAGGPVLASVDAHDNAISLYAWHNGGFVGAESFWTGQLPAQIIAADLNGDGLSDLVVRNAGDGTLSVFFATKFVGPVNPGFPPVSFLPPITIPVGLGASDVEAIDTTGSGRLDLVVTNRAAGQVSVLVNSGDGSFAPPVVYRAGTGLSAIDTSSASSQVTSVEATAGVAAGVFTTGGPTDLVTINSGSNALDVLAGLGGGQFANPVTIQTQSPAEVVRVADFNHDGIPDLAVLSASGVSIYLGNGKGGFLSPVTYNAGTEPSGMTVADVNGDGLLDLLIGNTAGDVLILEGNANGTFQPFEPVKAAIALAVADLTGNGVPDFVFADQSLDRVTVEYGTTKQSASTQVIASQSSGLLAPGAVKLADLNGDGIPDLIVANSGGNDVLVYPGLGNGQFGPSLGGTKGFAVGTDPTGLTVATLNGRPDLLVANTGSNDVSVLLGQGNGSSWTLIPGPRIKTDAGPVATVVGNLLGGSQTELAVANSQADNVQIFQSVGSGFFNDQPQAVKTIAVGQGPSALFLGDFNGLGLGLATLNAGSDNGSLISLAGSANPIIQSFPTGGDSPTTGFAGDFNGNGFTDLVVGNNGDGHLALLLGGSGGLSLSQTFSNPAAPNPTSLSFAGLENGILNFYVSTAGREAAFEMAFNLEGEAAVGPGSAPSLGPSAAPGLTIVQVSQVGGSSGSTLELIATLITLTVLPENLESELESAGGGTALLASFSPGASIGSGQSLVAFSGKTSEADLRSQDGSTGPGAVGPANAAIERLAPWAQFAIGLDDAWQELRARVVGSERDAPVPAKNEDAVGSGAPRARAQAPARLIPGADPSRSDTKARSVSPDSAGAQPQPVSDERAVPAKNRAAPAARGSAFNRAGFHRALTAVDRAIEELGAPVPPSRRLPRTAPSADAAESDFREYSLMTPVTTAMALSMMSERTILAPRRRRRTFSNPSDRNTEN